GAAQLAAADGARPHRIARDRARRHLERALALDPSCLAARYELAEMDIEEEHPDKALTRLAAAPEPAPAAKPSIPPGGTSTRVDPKNDPNSDRPNKGPERTGEQQPVAGHAAEEGKS